MKKQNKLEIIGFIIMIVGFILYIFNIYINIDFITENEKIFQIAVPLGLLIWSLGHMKKEKEQQVK